MTECKMCLGSGKISTYTYGSSIFSHRVTCPFCDGSGMQKEWPLSEPPEDDLGGCYAIALALTLTAAVVLTAAAIILA